MNEVR